MAKATAKTATTTVKKSAAKPKAKSSIDLDKLSEDILSKLKTLNIEQQLQADLEWCLGSYRYDQNASGLVEVIKKAFEILKQEQIKKTKGITAAFLNNIEKAFS
jgi:hypothetical protein